VLQFLEITCAFCANWWQKRDFYATDTAPVGCPAPGDCAGTDLPRPVLPSLASAARGPAYGHQHRGHFTGLACRCFTVAPWVLVAQLGFLQIMTWLHHHHQRNASVKYITTTTSYGLSYPLVLTEHRSAS
jgi:hypothetical protein